MTPALLTGRPEQRSTHRRLLRRADAPAGRERINAVIVPAARHASRLLPALRLAAELECPLVALCSHDADAGAVREAAWGVDATVIAEPSSGSPLVVPTVRPDTGSGSSFPSADWTR